MRDAPLRIGTLGADAVTEGAPFPTDAAAGVLNMRAIDAVYRAAGLPLRG